MKKQYTFIVEREVLSDMKKIGLVNIDTSHPFSWAEKMAQNPELDM